MMIVTAADWRFKSSAENLRHSAKEFGYQFQAYDLGELGFGIPHIVTNDQFIKNGFYNYALPRMGWTSKALHKPAIVARALKEFNDFVVYLDADTFLCDKIDEVIGDYSVGVTVRRQEEPCSIIGRINAGVIFFNANAIDLVSEWAELTEELKNDQQALNKLHQKHPHRFREFPTDLYNWYYFAEPRGNAKILHFKDNKHEMGGYIDDARRKRIV
jgi:hypothetical protein